MTGGQVRTNIQAPRALMHETRVTQTARRTHMCVMEGNIRYMLYQDAISDQALRTADGTCDVSVSRGTLVEWSQ